MRKDKYIQGFGDRLLEAIEKKGLTQTEVARRMGLTGRSAIYKYTVCNQMPSCHMLSKMAVVLGVSTDWLLGINGRKQ